MEESRFASRIIKVLFFLSVFLIITCDDTSKYILEDQSLELYQTNVIEFPNGYVSGVISKIVQDQNGDLFFIDFSKRSLLKYSSTTEEVTEVTGIGRGPNEFLRPIHVEKTSNKDELAVSDAASTNIKIISKEGEFRKTIEHKKGGKKFIVSDSLIFIKGVIDSLVQVVDFNGNPIDSFITAPKAYELRAKHFAGGGIAKVGSQVFLINSLEPRIYYFDTNNTDSISYIEPEFWKEFQENFDKEELMKKSGRQLIREKNKYAIFLEVFGLRVTNENYVVIIYAFDDREYLNIFNMDGDLVFYKPIQSQIIGTYENKLYGYDPKASESPLRVLEFTNSK